MNNLASFRDNSGFIFQENDIVFRQVNYNYKENYDLLISSGLYDLLTTNDLLISHNETSKEASLHNYYKILKPTQLHLITYPASWSFSMLKDAALLTLKIQKNALDYGMVLKDANSFNVQFLNGKPIFIDTLSFEKLKENQTWEAFGQFCRHFLAPLALLSYKDVNLNKLFILYLDGIPLNLAVKLLPFKAKFNVNLFLHLFLHNSLIQKNQSQSSKVGQNKFSLNDLQNQVQSLIDTIEGLNINKQQTEWGAYYENDVGDIYLNHKKVVINDILTIIKPEVLLDLGANDGTFSLIAAKIASQVLAFDIDPIAVEKFYLNIKKNKIVNITPLIVDITNPEPGIGWINTERESLIKRTKVDTIMVLALIHHLRITGGIPLQKIAFFLSEYCKTLIIEFIPKSDPKVKFLLRNREDIFDDYEEGNFGSVFSEYFNIIQIEKLNNTDRILYLMKKK